MWVAENTELDAQTTRTSIQQNGRILTYNDVIGAWRNDEAFCDFFTDTILETKFPAAFWETPPVASRNLQRTFEYVLVQGRGLETLTPEPDVFAQHFSNGHPIATFPNLGGDAFLIVPAPWAADPTYTHLLRFLRDAPRKQVRKFWQAAGTAMEARISDRPIWLSTAGMGVSWLHLRLDSRPKYYRHRPYQVAE